MDYCTIAISEILRKHKNSGRSSSFNLAENLLRTLFLECTKAQPNSLADRIQTTMYKKTVEFLITADIDFKQFKHWSNFPNVAESYTTENTTPIHCYRNTANG